MGAVPVFIPRVADWSGTTLIGERGWTFERAEVLLREAASRDLLAEG